MTLLPAAGAIFHLGAALQGVARMQEPPRAKTLETVGTYEVDTTTYEAGLRLHYAQVSRPTPGSRL